MAGLAEHARGTAPDGGRPARIRVGEVLRYLGYAGQELTEELRGRIEDVAARCDAELDPRWVWQAFPVQALPADEGPGRAVVGTALVLRGSSIASYLEGATHAALLACTLGAPCERALRRLGATDPVAQVVYDAACGDLVEWGCDRACEEIAAWAASRPAALACGERFSPGYGDLPLDVQPVFLDVLQAGKRLGLTASADDLLVPTKSVTAVVGLYPERGAAARTRDALGCAACNLRATCALRRRGTHCHRHDR